MATQIITANPGKNLLISFRYDTYARYPIRTHVISDQDDITKVCLDYAYPNLRANDILVISERIVSICQGRAYRVEDIKASWLAKKLSSYVYKSPYGIGLGSEYTMQLALEEAGTFRILIAAAIAAVTKPFGIRGIFYHLVGNNINAIDGPCAYTLPPYNGYAKLGPRHPNKVASGLSARLGCEVVIIDANDLGVNVLGRSNKQISKRVCQEIFKDNPLGQSSQQTPLCIVRRLG